MDKMTLLKLKEKYSSWISNYKANVYIYIDFNREFRNLNREEIDFLLNIEDEILNTIFRTINNTFNILKYIEIRKNTFIKKETFKQTFNNLKETYLQIKEMNKYVVNESRINIDELLEHYRKLIADLNTITMNKGSKIEIEEPNKFNFNPREIHKFVLSKGKYKITEYWENENITNMDDYLGVKHSITGNHLLSHNDVYRLTTHYTVEILKDYLKPNYILNLLNNIFKKYNSEYLEKKVNFNSLYKNTQKMRFYSISVYQPDRLKGIHPMYLPHIRLRIETKYPNTKQYIHNLFSTEKKDFPEIIP